MDRKKLEFRKVLGRVSDGLGGENVTALKNLCYDMIGERRREGIDSGIAIFNALIEESKSTGNVNTRHLRYKTHLYSSST